MSKEERRLLMLARSRDLWGDAACWFHDDDLQTFAIARGVVPVPDRDHLVEATRQMVLVEHGFGVRSN